MLLSTLLLTTLLLAPPAPWQDKGPTLPTTIEQALAKEPAELRTSLAGQPVEELQRWLTTWMDWIEGRQRELEAAYGKPVSLDGRLSRVAAQRDILLEGADVIADLAQAEGVDVQATRTRIDTIARTDIERQNEVFLADTQAFETVPIEVLRAFLRPMTKAEVQERLDAGIELLRRKCMVVRNVELAAMTSKGAESSEYFGRSILLQQEREALIARVRAMIEALERKGGDVATARAYVDSVVDRPAITGARALVAMARTWLVSAEGGQKLLRDVLRAAAVVVLSWLGARFVASLFSRGLRRVRNTSALLREFVEVSVRRVTVLLGLLVALSLLGMDMGPVLASIGAAGLVVGLALQGTLSNFASGILIMINRPFDVGDTIRTGGVIGTVRGLTLITTRIETADNQILFVPNNMVWNDVITNVAANPTRRVDLQFGISYGDDMQRAREVVLEVLRAHPKVLPQPEPIVRVHELADSSVNLVARPWARTTDYWEVYWDLTQAVKERFDKEGITIPFPQRDVHHFYGDGAPWKGREFEGRGKGSESGEAPASV